MHVALYTAIYCSKRITYVVQHKDINIAIAEAADHSEVSRLLPTKRSYQSCLRFQQELDSTTWECTVLVRFCSQALTALDRV